MKTTRPIRIAIAAAFMIGTTYAACAETTPPQGAAGNSTGTRANRLSLEKQSTVRVAKPVKKLSGTVPANTGVPILKRRTTRARTANIVRTQQIAPDHTVIATKGVSGPNGSHVNKPGAATRKAPHPVVSSATAVRAELPSTSLNSIRHLGPSPAVIDGRNFRTASTGGIGGSRASRKP